MVILGVWVFLMSEVPLYERWCVFAAIMGLHAHWDKAEHDYMGTSLIRTAGPVGPYSIPMPRDLRWS